jgi:PhnB protein
MEVTAYLNFPGTCAEAFQFYERALGGKILMLQRFSETPMGADMPADWKDKVIHVRMAVAGGFLMGSDAPPQHFKPAQGFSVTVATDTKADGERVFNALAEGGTVTMPFQSTFWSAGFGALVDRFGTPWMVNVNQTPQQA